MVSNKRSKNNYSKEFDMNSIPDVGSYFVTLKRKMHVALRATCAKVTFRTQARGKKNTGADGKFQRKFMVSGTQAIPLN